MDHTYRIIGHVDTSFNGIDHPWPARYTLSDLVAEHNCFVPFRDSYGFAAFFSCRSYISRHLSIHKCTSQELDYLLKCTLMRLGRPHKTSLPALFMRNLTITQELLRQGADPNVSLRLGAGLSNFMYDNSAWGCFFQYATSHVLTSLCEASIKLQSIFLLWEELIERFLSDGAETHISIFISLRSRRLSNFFKHRQVCLVLEESPLSYIQRRITCQVEFLDEAEKDLTRSVDVIKDFATIAWCSSAKTFPSYRTPVAEKRLE